MRCCTQLLHITGMQRALKRASTNWLHLRQEWTCPSVTACLLLPTRVHLDLTLQMSTTALPKHSSSRRHYFDTASDTPHNQEATTMNPGESGPAPRPKPNKTIVVPQEFRRPTHARECDNIVNEVKIITGCTVIPQWNDGRIYQFGIVGGGVGLEKAVRYINQWISNAHVKSKDSSAWARMSAFDPNKWYYEKIEEMERQRKEAFRGTAPKVSEGETPLQRLIIHWPEDLINLNITPRDVFGNKLEKLDAIRTDDEVFISILSAQGDIGQIEIQGTFRMYSIHISLTLTFHSHLRSCRHSEHRSSRGASQDND